MQIEESNMDPNQGEYPTREIWKQVQNVEAGSRQRSMDSA